MNTCPKCGHNNADLTSYCSQCGTYLVDGPSTEMLSQSGLPAEPQAKWEPRDPEPKSSTTVLVLLAENGAMIALPQVPTVNLGREGISRAGMMAIDLTPCGGDEAGVSRLHARIHRLSTGYFVEDCDSTNGSFLNGQRLVAYMPQGLAAGDDLMLGRLQFKVTFQSIGQ